MEFMDHLYQFGQSGILTFRDGIQEVGGVVWASIWRGGGEVLAGICEDFDGVFWSEGFGGGVLVEVFW